MVVADGFGMRLVAMALAVLLAVHLAIIGGSMWLRVRDYGTPLRPQLVAQTVATVELMEATPASERGRVLRAVNSPVVRYRLLDQFPAEDPHPAQSEARSPIALAYARALEGRPFYAYRRTTTRLAAPPGGPGRAPRPRHDRPPPHAPPAHAPSSAADASSGALPPRANSVRRLPPRLPFDVLLVLRLDDGSALVMESSPLHLRHLAMSMMLVVSSVVGLVLLVGLIWASLATSRPLAQMAKRVAAFATDLQATPMDEARGPGPVRRLAGAFNRMQDDLRRLVDQRTLTLAAIAHDYRNYLTRLRLRVEFIDDVQQREKAISDIDEMSGLLDDTLAYARHARDGAEAAQDAVDVITLLRDLLDDFAREAHDLSFSAGDEPVVVRADAPTLRRALANLIDNALRYGGSVSVTVQALTPSQRVRIAVQDRGEGVPEAQLARLTEPFYRMESSRSRETGGAGLGLAITRALIDSLGGELTLANRTGGGLEATVELGLAPSGVEVGALRS